MVTSCVFIQRLSGTIHSAHFYIYIYTPCTLPTHCRTGILWCVPHKILYGYRKCVFPFEDCLACDPTGESVKKIVWSWGREKSLCFTCVCAYMHICLSPGHSFALAKLKLKCSSAIDKICLLSQARKKTINHFPNCFPLPKTCSSVHMCVHSSPNTWILNTSLHWKASWGGFWGSLMPASQMASGRQIEGSCLYVQSQQPEMLSSTRAMLAMSHLPMCQGESQGWITVLTRFLQIPSARSHHKCLLAAVLPAPVAVSACSSVGFTPLALSPAILSAPQPTHTMWGACTWPPRNRSGFRHKGRITWFAFFPIWGYWARRGESWNPKPLCAYLFYDPVGCSVYSNPASIWIR